MASPVLAEKLRALQSLVSEPGFNEEAFDLWDEIKSDLSAEHRYRLIVAWSKSIDPGGGDRFVEACQRVIADLESSE